MRSLETYFEAPRLAKYSIGKMDSIFLAVAMDRDRMSAGKKAPILKYFPGFFYYYFGVSYIIWDRRFQLWPNMGHPVNLRQRWTPKNSLPAVSLRLKRLHSKELTSPFTSNVCNRKKGENNVYNFLSFHFLSAVVSTISS